MQAVTLHVPDHQLGTVLGIVRNLKDDLIDTIELQDNRTQEDAWFFERQKSLHALRESVNSGETPLYDFDTSIQELIAELEA
jgi:hypothetical protein